jgi:tripartite-type tricarboxylate transporter receptor subunit TctC
MKTLTWLALVGLCCAVTGPANAQSYPTKPIRFLVGFPPGGSTDLAARFVGRYIEKSVGQPVLVENRPGNSGAIAATAVSKAEADGYTLFFGSVTIAAPFFVKNGPVVGGKDLSPISSVTNSPFFLFVRPELPAQNLQQLIAYGKANPGKLNFGAASSSNTLAAEVFRSRTGLTFTNVAYKGAGPVATALAANEVDFTIDALPAYRALIQAGKVRPLFFTGIKRSPFAPSVPTAEEMGLPRFEISFRLSLWAPPATPRAIRDQLSSLVVAAVKDPEIAEQFAKAGAEGVGSSPDEMMRAYEEEYKFWQEAARLANFQPE